jgi:hypothetical protein
MAAPFNITSKYLTHLFKPHVASYKKNNGTPMLRLVKQTGQGEES